MFKSKRVSTSCVPHKYIKYFSLNFIYHFGLCPFSSQWEHPPSKIPSCNLKGGCFRVNCWGLNLPQTKGKKKTILEIENTQGISTFKLDFLSHFIHPRRKKVRVHLLGVEGGRSNSYLLEILFSSDWISETRNYYNYILLWIYQD